MWLGVSGARQGVNGEILSRDRAHRSPSEAESRFREYGRYRTRRGMIRRKAYHETT